MEIKTVALVGVLMLLPLLMVGFHPNLPLNQLPGAFKNYSFQVGTQKGSEEIPLGPDPKDIILGGLLSPEFDQGSCVSRYQSAMYRKKSPYAPFPYLLDRLRRYESLHKKCGPNTEAFNKVRAQLNNSALSSKTTECKYVIWIPCSGLGNQIITLASTFLYALLTNRVLLVDRGSNMMDLFCEPFPETTWLLPLDFPLNPPFNRNSPHSYGNMVKNNQFSDNQRSVYLHLTHDYNNFDKRFFCEEDQLHLEKVPWASLLSNNYFVPSLFQIPKYEEELHRLFPQRDTVFHHLGRYLFHPTNAVWGMIIRNYQAYLAKSNEILGIQIRIFNKDVPSQPVLDQILACTMREKLLPETSRSKTFTPYAPTKRSKAILITSLSSVYSEKIRDMYLETPTVNGEIVSVYQPSHEGHQQTEKLSHNMKAWAEIYLLSMADVLVTTSVSTFGYVGQGLSGVRPWILAKLENGTVPDPPCSRDISMDPCFHAPPYYDCKAKTGTDTRGLMPYIRHCQDVKWGLKLVERDNWPGM